MLGTRKSQNDKICNSSSANTASQSGNIPNRVSKGPPESSGEQRCHRSADGILGIGWMEGSHTKLNNPRNEGKVHFLMICRIRNWLLVKLKFPANKDI